MNWGNIASPTRVLGALRIEGRALWTLRHGTPDVILQMLGGIGDELLLTCVAHELRARDSAIAIWQISAAAELLSGNPDYALVLDKRYWQLRHSNLLGRWRQRLRYSEMPISGRYEIPPREHILAILCRMAGITGRVQLRPWVFLGNDEIRAGRQAGSQIAVQCVGQNTHETWMANKVWFAERFQDVVDSLTRWHPEIRIVQLGSLTDPALRGTLDLRGATTLKEAAAVLRSSECFVGTSGFLGHLARAVDCRAVIIYGGREHSWQSGYVCNENLERSPECAPCWLWHDCDYDRRCMRDITAQEVTDAVIRVLAKQGQPLEVEEVMLQKNDVPSPKTYPTIAGWRKIKPPHNSAMRWVDCNEQ